MDFGRESDDTPTARRALPVPPIRGGFDLHNDRSGNGAVELRSRIENSGAIPLSEAEIRILRDLNATMPIGKERAPFVSSGELEKLVVNVLMVIYVP